MGFRVLPLLATALMIATAQFGVAQQRFLPDVHNHAPGRGACGMIQMGDGREADALYNTAKKNPELYRRMIERSKRPAAARMLSVADDITNVFQVRNQLTDMFEEVTAKLVFDGRRARIWVDLRDTGFVRKATIATMARALDTSTSAASRNPALGIIENDEAVFGLPPANRFDDVTPNVEDFLLTDIKEDVTNGVTLGYFSPWDQTDNPGSNKMNLLYIDTRQGLGNQNATALNSVLSTIAHEYQHLIHFNLNPDSEIFYNEGCSELASTLCGYYDRTNANFLSNTNTALLRWSTGDGNLLEIDYQRALCFMRYAYEQYGEAFVTKLVASTSGDVDRLSDAFAGIGLPKDWQSMMRGFWTTCYVVRNYPDSHYVWRRSLSNSAAKVTNTYANQIPATGEAIVQQYAAIYNLYTLGTPGGLKIRFQAGQPYAVMAILYRGTQIAEIKPLANNVDNVLGQDVAYSKIMLVVINLSFNAQTIRWTAEGVTTGVDDATAGTQRLAFTSVAPNPASGPAVIRYRTTGSRPVTLRVFDLQGSVVSTLVAAEQLAEGEHVATLPGDGLASGTYLLRLEQGAATAISTVSVAR